MIKKLNPSLALVASMILVLAVVRIPNALHFNWLSNFTPVGAMALFSGSHFSNKWKAILIPLVALFISDLCISFAFDFRYGFIYSNWYLIYSIFIVIVLIGRFVIKKTTFKTVLLASILSSLTHWVLADFIVWILGGTNIITQLPLTKDWQGLVQCYIQGFPFMKNFFLGTIFYSSIIFSTYYWVTKKYSLYFRNI